jgi:hypothetical protein
MTINFNIELQVPDELKSIHNDELNEFMYDAILRYAMLHHNDLATHFSSKDDKSYDVLASYHEGWYKTLSEVHKFETKVIL